MAQLVSIPTDAPTEIREWLAKSGILTTVVDDMTSREIEGKAYSLTINVTYTEVGSADTGDEIVSEGTYEVSYKTARAFIDLANDADLAAFVIEMRPYLKLNSADPEVVRKWARTAHPELNINERGRIPSEVMALYRREVVQKANAADSRS